MKSQAVTPADLCRIRKILRRSPADMAAMADATGAEWETWETGEQVPSPSQLEKLIALKRLASKMSTPARYKEERRKK